MVFARDRELPKTVQMQTDERPLRELALFAGAGGGLLASKLLQWKTVAAVERDEHCLACLEQRQREGALDDFPIYRDVCEFDGAPWRNRVDVVSGGFPCQPFSSAARGRNVARDLWPHMLRIIIQAGPLWVFAENVQLSPLHRASNDLSALGYRSAVVRLGAADLGLPHRRNRFWLAAYSNGNGQPVGAEHEKMAVVCDFAKAHSQRFSLRGVRGADGLARRLGRLRAAGNGQVPRVAVAAWDLLSQTLK